MISSLPLAVFAIMVLFLVAMSGIAVYAGVRSLRQAALVRVMRTTPIADASGYVEIEGTVEAIPGPAVKAPLTGETCCWYEGRVEEHVSSRSGDSRQARWQGVRNWSSAAPFLCRDASGVCVVLPHRAEVTPTDQSIWYGSSASPRDRNPPKVGPTVSPTGFAEVSGSARYRYTEKRIYAGDPVLILGEMIVHGTDIGADSDSPGDEPRVRRPPGRGRQAAPLSDLERDDVLLDRGRAIADATIAFGTGARPMIITTTPQAEHLALTVRGGSTALGIALVPLALAVWLLWIRFG